MRPWPRSIHARMMALFVGSTLVALAVAGFIIAGVLERFVIGGLDRRLDAELTILASSVDSTGRIDRAALGQRTGLLEGGAGWRWRIEAPTGAIGSADFPTLDRRPPRPPGDIPDNGPLGTRAERPAPREGVDAAGDHVHARAITLATAGGPVTLTAAAPRDVVRRPIAEAMASLLLAVAALAVVLGLSAVVQLRLGLGPVRRLRDQVAAIRAGTRDAVDEDQPSELRPLAAEINALTRDGTTALSTARHSAANLAHALKTPVATLALDLRDEPARAAQVARIDRTIRHHLARARTEAIDRRAATLLAPAIGELAAALRKLYRDRNLAIDDAVAPDDLAVAVDRQDLDELVGNLLDNAAKNASGRVSVRAAPDAEGARRVLVEVCDDGPGIPAADRARVTRPGTRLDERGEGHGFGLGIVADLAALYGGALVIADAPGGGVRAVLTLPASAKPR